MGTNSHPGEDRLGVGGGNHKLVAYQLALELLLPHAGERELLPALTRLQRAVQARPQSTPVPVTFSIGGVTFTQAPADVKSLLAEADSLMYEVKASGKNAARTRVYPGRDGRSEGEASLPAPGE